MKKLKCYHYCENSFYEELLQKEIIEANDEVIIPDEKLAEHYVKEYAFKVKKMNNGNGMFFAWSNPAYKGNIEFCDNGKYSLLELEVEEDMVVKTNYENWCSFGMDLYDNDGDINEADEYCREIGIVDGINGSYNAIFDCSDQHSEIQILLPYIKKDWIQSVKRCVKKYI